MCQPASPGSRMLGKRIGRGSAYPFAPRPTAGSEQRVVHLPERSRGARGCERGALGASEAYHRLRPGRGVARIDGAPAQFSVDDIDTRTHNLRRKRAPHEEKAVGAEVVN